MGCVEGQQTTPAGPSLHIYHYLMLNSNHDACVLGSDIKIHIRVDNKISKNNILDGKVSLQYALTGGYWHEEAIGRITRRRALYAIG